MPELSAVVLAGGLGTRLRPVLKDTPKALAPLGGRPFLDRILEFLQGSGISQVVLALGHLAETVMEHCGEGRRWGMRLDYVREEEPLGTAGGARLAASRAMSDPFLVMNGDSLLEADLGRLLAFHRERSALATLALTPVDDRSRFGSVELAEDGAVSGFLEKGRPGPGLISAGLYVIQSKLFDELSAGAAASLEHDVFPAAVGRGLFGSVCAGRFTDIGTPEAYAAAIATAEPA